MTPASKNVTWLDGYLTRDEREALHGHKGAAVWFTRFVRLRQIDDRSLS